ncbi:hypothetical protein C7H84_34835 [Burkholderia sp. Nafp2/4-1b]|uniref:hypothetical protein n=1 Tax=Burkholderia sp. Nafp2/4-1b TaxID=2116686 RepID=UPI000F0FD613|nr:hypothetical protein [Burkholderia sp. Nafp2/4-1b]RKT98835.1 hypothetical protein C7H84_34835 [Burkholderia sp. Nafp2/4-1b]
MIVHDAVAGGCNLFYLERLRRRYSAADCANLLMCRFIGDSVSVLELADVQRSMIDSCGRMDRPQFAVAVASVSVPRAVGRPQLGRTGDPVGPVAVAQPCVEGGSFRALSASSFEAQAVAVEQITQRNRVGYIAINTTGVGRAAINWCASSTRVRPP